MTKILTTAEHNQARADLATLTAIVENYAVTHPKKHGWSTLGAFCMPAVFVLIVGYPAMTDIDPLTGAVFSLIGCVMLYGAEVLMLRSDIPAGMVPERITIEDIMLYMAREER